MTKIAFFGNLGVLNENQQQSTIVRVLNLSRRLEEDFGHTCTVTYSLSEKLGAIPQIIRNSDIVFFHRIQYSKATYVDLKFLIAFLLSKKYNKKTIFDFDDSIFLTFPIITELLISRASVVFAGSHYLHKHAARLNSKTSLIPSAVDTNVFKPAARAKNDGKIVIGWHGSMFSHFKNVSSIIPVMRVLGKKYDVRFKLIGTRGAVQIQSYFSKMIRNVEFDFGPDEWVSYDELPLLMSDIDISISPLLDNMWTRGKCAMKALESMALGIPVVADAVGEHNYVIRNCVNGFLAKNDKEWIDYLSLLIDDNSLRRQIGNTCRNFVERYYSLDCISLKVHNLIKTLLSEVD